MCYGTLCYQHLAAIRAIVRKKQGGLGKTSRRQRGVQLLGKVVWNVK